MKKVFKREEIIERLNKTISENRPILGAGCSAGLIAKCAEIGGADLIIVYSTGKSRLMGLPTSTIGDSNAITLSMCEEIRNVVKGVPIIAGIEAVDPRKMALDELIEPFIQVGYSGIINFPTIALMGEERIAARESVGLGFTREVEMIRTAHQMGVFTMVYVFNPEQTRRMVEAHADCIVPHVFGTAGGLVGFKNTMTKENAAETVQEMIQVAKSINPQVICLAHGGPFENPKDTGYLYEHTDAKGFVGASSIERIPIEKAVTDVVKEFKSVSLKSKQEYGNSLE
jgi:predicted TIM-barrel enzyme